MNLDEFDGIFDNILKVNKNGWWQVYVFDDEKYKVLGNRILYFNGKYYDKTSNEPWSNEDVNDIGILMNLYNKDGYPFAVIKLEEAIENEK